MTAPNHCVLDGTVGIAPRRPDSNCEDMGGLQFQDMAGEVPRPNEHLSAKDFKQVEMLLQRAWRMLPTLSFDIHVANAMGTISPSVISTANDNLIAGDIDVAPTGTTGEYVVTLPGGAAALPAATRSPVASLVKADNYANSGDAANVTVYAYTSTTITIRVRDFTGVLSGVGATVRVDVF